MAMNEITPERVAARYDGTLRRGHHGKFLPGVTKPQFTDTWPKENIALLARYCIWLQEEDSTLNCIEQVYLPMAGHILGLNLKPHTQLNLDTDLEKAMDYIKAKQLSRAWTDNCRRAMNRFCRFLKYERGLLDVTFNDVSVCVKRYQVGLPDWLIEQLTHFQHLRQANWRPSRLRQAIQRFWNNHTQVWRWLFAQDDIQELRDIKRKHLFAYIDDLVGGPICHQDHQPGTAGVSCQPAFLARAGVSCAVGSSQAAIPERAGQFASIPHR
jgi:hypothetical protein